MAFGFSLGFKLGAQQGRPPKPHDPLPALKAAIEGARLVEARYEGKSLTMEPYAVFETETNVILAAVVLRAEDAALNRWEPQFFDVKKLKNERPLEATFLLLRPRVR